MNRDEFLLVCSNYFEHVPSSLPSSANRCSFDVDVTVFEDEAMYHKALQGVFKGLFEVLELPGMETKSWFKTFQTLHMPKDYDDCFEEDNPDCDICRFNVEVNLHALYDELALRLNPRSALTTLWRIESADSTKGLYSHGVARALFDPVNQPGPLDDACIASVFEDVHGNDRYRRQWSFAFSSVAHAHSWMQTDDLHGVLKKEGLCLKKIMLPECFVVTGDKQSIFKSDMVLVREICAPDEMKMVSKAQPRM